EAKRDSGRDASSVETGERTQQGRIEAHPRRSGRSGTLNSDGCSTTGIRAVSSRTGREDETAGKEKAALSFGCFELLLRSFRNDVRVLLLEPIHTTFRIDQFLLTGEERVASRTNFHAHVAIMGGTRLENVPARTRHFYYVMRAATASVHKRCVI